MNALAVYQSMNEYRVPDIAGNAGFFSGTSDHDPWKSCARIADGKATDADLAWVGRAFSAFLCGNGEIPLERCLRLPSTHTGWRKFHRNTWLCKAASLIDVGGSWGGPKQLEIKWNKFISRGPWQAWRDDEHPPEYATKLNEALFYATRLNRSDSLNVKQISRITGHVFQVKSR